MFTDEVRIARLSDSVASGTDPVVSAGVDMAGFEGVTFIAELSVGAAGNFMTAGYSPDGVAAYAPNTAAVQSGAGGAPVQLQLDIKNPSQRFANVTVILGTPAAVDSIWAIQYEARNLPLPPVAGQVVAQFSGV